MEVVPAPASSPGPPQWFTGDVWIDAIATGAAPPGLILSAVRFAPGARTAWHAHESGQTLFVTEGRGRAQSRGSGIVELRPGDIVVTPGGEEHWHGAAPDHAMSHLSMTSGPASWGDHVSEAEYRPTTAP